MEKIMKFGIRGVKFIDAFQCMASSLETVANSWFTKSTDTYEMFEIMENILTLMS